MGYGRGMDGVGDGMKRFSVFGLGLLAFAAQPVQAEVTSTADNGFVVHHEVRVAADPEAAYAMIRSPAKWWSPEHSWTGHAENFYMDAQAGGCFCELIPATGDSRERTLRGSVQHMRILYADPGKMLRLSGALGPLQSEALAGTMTILLKPAADGTEISFDYIVGGYMRFAVSDIAPAVDAVIGEQALRLAKVLGRLDNIGEDDSAATPNDINGMRADQSDFGPENVDEAGLGSTAPSNGSLADTVAGLGRRDDDVTAGSERAAPPER